MYEVGVKRRKFSGKCSLVACAIDFAHIQLLAHIAYCSDEVHRFESQMKKFVHLLEDGVDVVMWQINRSEDTDANAEFPLKASHVTVQLQRRGELYVQSSLNFVLRGGYLSKAIGRNRGGKFGFKRFS